MAKKLVEEIEVQQPGLKLPKNVVAEFDVSPQKQPSAMDHVIGGGLALGDFVAQIPTLPFVGLGGLAAGVAGKLKGKSFVDEAVKNIESNTRTLAPSTYIDPEGKKYPRELADKVLAAPGELGAKAIRGFDALIQSPFIGLDAAARRITNPESTPITSALEDTAGVFMGYGLAGRGIHKAGQGLAKIDPTIGKYEKPGSLAAEGKADLGPVPYTEEFGGYTTRPRAGKKGKGQPKNKTEAPSYLGYDSEGNPIMLNKGDISTEPKTGSFIDPELGDISLRPENRQGSFIYNRRTNEYLPLPKDPFYQKEAIDPIGQRLEPDFTIDPTENFTGYRSTRDTPEVEKQLTPEERQIQDQVNYDLRNFQNEADAQARPWVAEDQARREWSESEQNTRREDREGIDYETTTDPTAERLGPIEKSKDLKDRAKEREAEDRPGERYRPEDKDKLDIPLRPEEVNKDPHLKGLITRHGKLKEEIDALEKRAAELATEGARIKNENLGTTDKAKREIAELNKQREELYKKRDVLIEQIYARARNKHGKLTIEVLKDEETEAPRLSVFEGIDFENPQWFNAERPVDRTVMEGMDFGPTREQKLETIIEKTETPNMQRSPDADVTNQWGVRSQADLMAEQRKRMEENRQSSEGQVPQQQQQQQAIDTRVFEPGFKETTKEILKTEGLPDLPVTMTAEHLSGIGVGGKTSGILQVTATNEAGKPIGKATFSPEDFSSTKPNPETNLFSVDTSVANTARHRGLAQAMYRFASQLGKGNDIVPSRSQSQMGRKMWEGFEKSGLSEGKKIPGASRPINKGPGGKQSGGYDPHVFTEGLSKLLGKGKSVEEMRRELGYEPPEKENPKSAKTVGDGIKQLADFRPVEEMVKEEINNISPTNDLSPGWRKAGNLLQGKSIASIARNNPVVRWFVDRVVQLDREAMTSKENALWGEKFASNIRGWGKRIKGDDGALTIYDRLSAKRAEPVRAALVKYSRDNSELLANGLRNPTLEMLKRDGLDSEQAAAARAMYDQFEKIFDEANKVLEAQGKEPIPYRAGYFPSTWMGDYRIFVKDKNGEVVYVKGLDTAWQAKKATAELRKRFPDMEVGDAVDASKGKYNLNDVSAFRLALDVMEKDSPAYQALEAAMSDILKHRGFQKRSLQKKGREGFLGSEEGPKGTEDAKKAVEQYITTAYNFIANQKKKIALAELHDQVKANGKNLRNEMPETSKFVEDYLNNSVRENENLLKLVDNMVEWAGSSTGLGRNFFKTALSEMNGVAGLAWLFTAKFLGVQMAQPMYALAKLRSMKLDIGNGPGAMEAFTKAYYETFIKPSVETKQALTWAKRNGYIDAKILDLMGTKFNKTVLAKAFVEKGGKHTLAWWEQEVVRTPVFNMFNIMLKNSIKDNQTRWKTAGALTDQYMIDYGRTESPFVYGKTGMVGEAVRPLKQYAHGYFGQMLEYALATKRGQYSPLAYFIMTQWIVAGIKGMVGVATINAGIQAWNKTTGDDIPTITEMLLSSGASDTALFGPVSSVTGMDMSGSLGAPQAEELITAPGLEFGGKIAKEGFNLGMKSLKGEETEADKMRFAQAVTPTAGQALVENKFKLPDGSIPDPNNKMLPQLGPRTKEDWTMRALGGRSVSESKEKMKLAELKRTDLQRANIRGDQLDVIVDRIKKGENFDKAIDKFIEKGGDPRQLKSVVVKRLIDENMSLAQRYIVNAKGLSAGQKAERLEKFKIQINKMTPDELGEVARELK